MESSRFFVANLPRNTKEQDLRQLFQNYGEVTRVELKTKESLTDLEDVKILAFVTLNIGADDAHYCLGELNWQKLNGAAIKVSLAKESFLERLKREREEAEAATAAAGSATTFVEGGEGASELLSRNSENTRKTFELNADDDDEDDESIAPDLLITKRRAASSLHNGRIVIQSFDTAPLHVIEAKKHATAARQHLDAKSSSADQKRKESQNKKKTQYQQNKTAIQQALAGGLDASGNKANRIKFSDSEEDEEEDAATAAKPKTDIFGSDDEDEAADLNLKPEHFSKKGEKLVQLQSKQSLDPRFRIDAKFVDEDEADEEAEKPPQSEQPKKKPNKRSYTREGERDWQMGILEQVVGSKVDTGNAAQKAAKNKKMQRYDPANDEHQKFLRPDDAEAPPTKANKKKKTSDAQAAASDNDEDAENAPAPEVSKELFYVVTDTLAESLKTRGEGFSLLNMFGQSEAGSAFAAADVGDRRSDQLKKAANERILVNKLTPNALNPFSYDSSSEEDGETEAESAAVGVVKNAGENVKEAQENKKPRKVKVVMETFFIPKNDARLKEGAKFFKYAKRDTPTENYEEVRNRLKLLIKTKITKSKRNLVGGGGSQKRKTKRY